MATLTPEQINEYYATEGKKTNPMSPSDWMNSKNPGPIINQNSDTAPTTNSGTSDPYYGFERNSDWEGPAFQETNWAVSAAQDSGLISPSYLSTITNDPNRLSFYVNALAYGGYTIGDIVNDLKRGEMIANGDESVKSIILIDPEMTKNVYQSTSKGQNSYRTAATAIPTYSLAGNVNPEILKYGMNIPDELFKTLVPLLDRDSEEFKTAVENVKSAFYDVANQQLQAESEQEKAAADYNYNQFKEQVERQYGIALSDDATKAWAQIEGLGESYSGRGIQNSGLHMEDIDSVLKDTRKQDQRLRQEKLTKEEQQMAATYASSATPEQIKALIDEDIAKGLSKDKWRATKWGLVPSDDLLQKYSMESLRERYPDQSEEELKAYRDSVLDENGNYRSTIYSKYYSGVSENKANKKALAEEMVTTDTLNKEASKYRNYDVNQTFSQTTPSDDQTVKDAAATELPKGNGVTGTQVPDSVSKLASEAIKKGQDVVKSAQTYMQNQNPSYNAAADAAANINKNTNTPTPPAPSKTGYQGGSIVDYLSSTGGDSSYTNRAKIAKEKGIANYTGTAEQNTQLLKQLRGY